MEQLTVKQTAEQKQVTAQSVYDILRDDQRRAEIFPNAQKIGVGKRGTWLLNAEDVEAWQPRNYPRE